MTSCCVRDCTCCMSLDCSERDLMSAFRTSILACVTACTVSMPNNSLRITQESNLYEEPILDERLHFKNPSTSPSLLIAGSQRVDVSMLFILPSKREPMCCVYPLVSYKEQQVAMCRRGKIKTLEAIKREFEMRHVNMMRTLPLPSTAKKKMRERKGVEEHSQRKGQ